MNTNPIRRHALKREAEKLLKERNRQHAMLKHSFDYSSQHPEWKILPSCTKYQGTDDVEPQFWYNARISQHVRIKYYKDRKKRFKKLTKQQADFRKDRSLDWVEIPGELIDELHRYESNPSDELIHLAVS